ncbi:MAG: SDR family NAD(P)-dependent oxidoreductase [Phycisphaerales bacterium]
MNIDFAGRSIVVTGGTGALGSAVVSLLLESGGSCIVPVFAREELARFPYANHPRVRIVEGVDLSDDDAVTRFYAAASDHAKAGADPSSRLWASIHIAGGFAMAPLAETTADLLRRQFSTNVLTCALCCREAVRSMRAAKVVGRIVNVAARPGLEPEQGVGMSAYAVAKAGVAALTRCLAAELAPEGIWVNAVVPSIMDTPANRRAMPSANHDAWPKLADVAATIAFLASPQNAVTRGGLVPVYGKA